jgi:hypothetical protein
MFESKKNDLVRTATVYKLFLKNFKIEINIRPIGAV